MTIETSFTARVAGLRDAAARARSGTLRPAEATTVLIDAGALIDVLDLQAFPMSGGDTLEQVVMRVHGIDVSVQGRPDDVFVHIEDHRNDEDRTAQPLTIEVGHTGEIDFTEPGPRTPEQQDDGE